MATSILIAKLFAVCYLFIGFGMLMNPSHYKKMMDGLVKDTSLMYFGGILATLAGLLIMCGKCGQFLLLFLAGFPW